MSSNNLSGCSPIAPPKAGDVYQPIRATVFELGPGGLGPEDYRGVIVPAVAVINAGDVSGQVAIRAPATHNLIIEKMYSHVALIDLANETLDLSTVMVGNFTNSPLLSERIRMKAMNARATFENTDRSLKAIDGGLGSLNLASILPSIGGQVIDWSARPYILPHGETLQLNITLLQSDAKILGGKTEYGLILVGSYVRVANS